MAFDFNDANSQQFGDLIPKDTVCKVLMQIRPGGEGPEGWLTQSNTSDAIYINAEFTVLEGPFAKRKLWQNLTFSGGKVNENGQSIAGEITRTTLRAILESSRNIMPTDMSENALQARRVQSFGEFDGISFIAKIGIEKGKDGYDDKNKIAAVITPDKKEYAQAVAGGFPAAQPQAQTATWANPSRQAKPEGAAPAWATGGASPSQAQQSGNSGKSPVPAWAR